MGVIELWKNCSRRWKDKKKKQIEKNILFQETFQLFGLFIECRFHIQVVAVVTVFVHLKRGVFQLLVVFEEAGQITRA